MYINILSLLSADLFINHVAYIAEIGAILL